MFSRVLPPSIFALATCSQSAEYCLTVSRFIAATRGLRVSQLHVSVGTSQEAGRKHRWARYGSSTIRPGRGWCCLLPAQRLRSSAGTPERKEINHKLHLVSDCVKQMGYLACSHLEGGWLPLLGGLLHVLFPWWLLGELVLSKHVLQRVGVSSEAHLQGLARPFLTRAELCCCWQVAV